VALTGHQQVAPNHRAALATRIAALSGSQPKSLRLCRRIFYKSLVMRRRVSPEVSVFRCVM
jgi:hypothetical protein